MFRRVCLSVALLLCSVPLWSQVEPSATGGSGATDDDSYMSLQPQISGSFYPSSVASQERSNVLYGGILVSASYDDNVLAGETAKPIGAESYAILPNIELVETTSRVRGTLSYSPGFTFYDPTTELNDVTQNGVADFQYRWTPRLTIGAQEVFFQNSTVFSEPYTVSGATISAADSSSSPVVIIPYAGQLTDSTAGHIGYQFSRNSMVSASGSFSSFHFSNTALLSGGLYNSNSGGGSGAYSHRMTRTQAVGFSYTYSISKTDTFSTTTTNHTVGVLYSVGISKAFSLALTGGPEYSTTSIPAASPSVPAPAPIHTWAPSVNATIGWQRTRADLSLSYARAITTGYGLLGSFTTDRASMTAGWKFSRRLIGSLSGNYSNTRNATPSLITSNGATGHTIFGRASLQYLLGEHLTAVGEYTRLHADYSGITALSNSPDSDRVTVSLNYVFQRALGR
jgi:hypothetical protein